eukprot:3352074-Amphidinium_carterae.1
MTTCVWSNSAHTHTQCTDIPPCLYINRARVMIDQLSSVAACGFRPLPGREVSGTTPRRHVVQLLQDIFVPCSFSGQIEACGGNELDKQLESLRIVNIAMARILCFGDSNTAGFHSGGCGYEPYASTLATQLAQYGWNCSVQQEGLSGLTAQTMVAKGNNSHIMDIAGLPHKGLSLYLQHDMPDIVLIMAGTNDLGQGQAPEEILRNVIHLHQQCHAVGVATVAIAPPTISSGPLRQK